MEQIRRPRIYVAGMMRTVKFYAFPDFDAARDRLNALGWDAVSPTDIDRCAGFDAMTLPEDFDWGSVPEAAGTLDEIMLRDIEALETTDAIFMLHGWEASSGANRELAEARKLGLREFYEDVCASPSPSVMSPSAVMMPQDSSFMSDAEATALSVQLAAPTAGAYVGPCDEGLMSNPLYRDKVLPTPVTVTERDSVLDEAKRLVSGERDATYGSPCDHFAHVAKLLNVLFESRLKEGARFYPQDVAWFQIMVKASRAQKTYKRDNFVDVAGYAACGAEVAKAQVLP